MTPTKKKPAAPDASKKNPHAVALGKRGGRARRDRLTPEQRSELAGIASNARWDAVRSKAAAGKPRRRKRAA